MSTSMEMRPTSARSAFSSARPTRWRHGLGTDAAYAGLAHGFTVLGLSRIWAEAVEANVSSVRVLRRVGMREIGPGDAESFLGTPSRLLRFDLSRADWLADGSAASAQQPTRVSATTTSSNHSVSAPSP